MLDRRSLLKLAAAGVAGNAAGRSLAASFAARDSHFGWYPNREHQKEYIRRTSKPFLGQNNTQIKGSGKGKKAALHLALEKVSRSKYVPHDQDGLDCIGHAFALGVDVLAAVQIAIKRYSEWWIAKAAPEPIYGGSRVEIGGGGLRFGGSQGHWAADWLMKYGVLLQKPYPGGHDFTTYSGAKSREMGASGVPDELEPHCKQHPVKRVAICKSYSELRDCIYNGSPVVVCSNVGFGNPRYTLKRDDEGFLKRDKWNRWMHAMLFAAYDDEYKRPGALCFNSWGEKWIKGPIRGNQPPSTFWVDADTVDTMLGQGDSFALSAYVGFPRIKDIPAYILH